MPIDIHAVVAEARRLLRAIGIPPDEAALDARVLAQHVLGWSTARLLAHGDEPATVQFRTKYEGLVARRAQREPLAYITGTREFWTLDIEVTPAVLVPRPETELLIEASVEYFDRSQPLRIADVCTGSGCVAVALGREFPRAQVVASDTSESALAVARRNISRHGLDARVRTLCTDLVEGMAEQSFDLVVANPPYIPVATASALPPEVGRYEPATALFGGEDGLRVTTRLLAQAPRALVRDGLLIVEIGVDQARAVESIVTSQPLLTLVDIKRDLQDIPRTAVIRRR